ncbi:TPA: hypothetical protein P6201_004525 [Escherichia coli]|nr:hypothetical protein [Escherichia coli]
MEKKNRPLQAANSDIRVSDVTPLTKSPQAPKRTPKKHRARVYMLRTGINHQHSDHPHYIPNGAFIAAMVASGYKVKPAGRMNAFFNISKKGLCAAMGKN